MKNQPSIILASKSPRRQELLQQLGLDFRVVLKDVDESFPASLAPEDVALFIAEKKARAFDESLQAQEVVITADTIVTIDGEILGKPLNEIEAFAMLPKLSGRKHEVITGVALLQNHQLHSFAEKTEVFVRSLTDSEIKFYIQNYQPYDKAGAYGIQEWFGMVAIQKIVGSYSNVVGLPTHRVYETLAELGWLQ